MYRNLRSASIIAVALAVLTFGVALAYTKVAVFSNGFEIEYISRFVTVDQEYSTWTYAVTEPAETVQGLSHWTMGICTTFGIETLEGPYTTITSIPECTDGTFNCQSADYTVEWDDITTGIDGIKFEDPSPALDGGPERYTHVFQFEVYHPDGFIINDQDVGGKWGGLIETRLIKGLLCPPTAVSMASFGASTGQSPLNIGLILMFAAGLLLLVGGGSYILARRMA